MSFEKVFPVVLKNWLTNTLNTLKQHTDRKIVIRRKPKPGSNINSVDGLITNFHTPKSTLLLLVYAFIGEQKTKKLYKYAIKKKLRFFSYGDACLLWKT